MKSYKIIRVMPIFKEAFNWVSSHLVVLSYYLSFTLLLLFSVLVFISSIAVDSMIAILLGVLLSIALFVFSILGLVAVNAMLARHITHQEPLGMKQAVSLMKQGFYWSYLVFPLLVTAAVEIVNQMLLILTVTLVVFVIPYVIFAIGSFVLLPSFVGVFSVACLSCEERRVAHWLKLAWFHMKYVFMRYLGALLLGGLIFLIAIGVLMLIYSYGGIIGQFLGIVGIVLALLYYLAFNEIFEAMYYVAATKANPKIVDYNSTAVRVKK